MAYTPFQSVELFHLIFLEQLTRKLDRRLYALKGGCNLRFFLGSVRYSQDIDLDVKMVRAATLQKTVNNILEASAIGLSLRPHGIQIGNVSEAKQTETTQRWKIQLKIPTGSPFPTKIEFSRRGLEEPIDFEPVDSSILRMYQQRPLFASHYGPVTAFKQKIRALSLRTETQARDIWDLFHLIQAYGIKETDAAHVSKACANACTISFADFKDQVMVFLPPDMQRQYDREIWDTIQLRVIDYLETLQ